MKKPAKSRNKRKLLENPPREEKKKNWIFLAIEDGWFVLQKLNETGFTDWVEIVGFLYIYTLAPTSVKGKWFAATTLLDFVTLTDPFPSFYFTYIYEIKLLLKLIKLIHFFF